MNITNIKKISFTKYEIAAINTVREYLRELEGLNDLDDDGKELRISFYQDVVVIDWMGDGDSTEFNMLQGKVTINNFEPSDEVMKLYCQAEYLVALEGATSARAKVNDRSIYMNASCNVYHIGSGTYEFAIDMDLLSEVNEYLCPSLLTI